MKNFFNRADAHIHLSTDQITDTIGRGKVSATMMYATARFNSWITACGSRSAGKLSKVADETIDYFVTEYRQMLEENLEDYIENFESYMRPTDEATWLQV